MICGFILTLKWLRLCQTTLTSIMQSPMEFLTEHHRTKRYFWTKGEEGPLGSLVDVKKKRIDRDALAYFLTIGYVPGTVTLFEGVDCLPGGAKLSILPERWAELEKKPYFASDLKAQLSGFGEEELIELGIIRFRQAIESTAKVSFNREWVVPISGGMDSRAILAALLEYRDAKNIVTYTFGLPGTFDFEIGNQVASFYGTSHRTFDLSRFDFSEDKFLFAAEHTDGNTDIFQPVFLFDPMKELGYEPVYWSGYTGDGIGGSHYYPADQDYEDRRETIVAKYLDSERLVPKSIYNPRLNLSLVTFESNYGPALGKPEELFFVNHVERYSVNHILLNKYDYRTPFMDEVFTSFFFNLPTQYRKGKRLFDSILVEAFPKAFSLPLKKDFGLSITASYWRKILKRRVFQVNLRAKQNLSWYPWQNPMLNYINYGETIRSEPSLKSIVQDAISDLSDRGIVHDLDVKQILDIHSRGQNNYTKLLMLLVSLEFIIRANEV